MEPALESLGDRVRRLREKRGIRWASDLDDAAGLTRGHTALIESGVRGSRMTAWTALKLARAFGITVDELLSGTDVGGGEAA